MESIPKIVLEGYDQLIITAFRAIEIQRLQRLLGRNALFRMPARFKSHPLEMNQYDRLLGRRERVESQADQIGLARKQLFPNVLQLEVRI